MTRRLAGLVLLLAAFLAVAPRAWPAETAAAPEKGKVQFKSVGDESKLPEIYRLEDHEFPFEMGLRHDLSHEGFQVFDVRFPSPIESPHKENNTVHAEYYRPLGKGPFPGVVILDIMAGDQLVSRLQAVFLAKQGVAGLVVYMPYYGPRRPNGEKVRMLSPDLVSSIASVRQTVLDVRRATAWLESRPEVDGQRLGVLGTSLGSFVGTLAAEMEPRLRRVAILLGGGGLVDAFYDDPRAKPYRFAWELLGGTKESLTRILAPVDPITHAERLRKREILMIGAKRDDIIPPRATEALWTALGKPKIVWYDATHVGAALHMIPMMEHVITHFKAR